MFFRPVWCGPPGHLDIRHRARRCSGRHVGVPLGRTCHFCTGAACIYMEAQSLLVASISFRRKVHLAANNA